MDLGLYTLKYGARERIAWALPAVRDLSPNTVTLSMLPLGLLTAAAYAWGARGATGAYVAGALLVLARMFVGTLDGLMAARFGRSTSTGAILNRAVPELCDALYLGALALARPEWHLPGALALVGAWLVSFAGTAGTLVGGEVQSVGPAGQTDRLAVLIVASFAEVAGAWGGFPVNGIYLFLWWTAAASVPTAILRFRRAVESLGREPVAR